MFKRDFLKSFIFAPFIFSIMLVHASWYENINDLDTTVNKYPFYIGASGGWGSTNWSGLVDKYASVDSSDTSVPVSAKDSGAVLGIFAGYDFNSNFAIQLEYQHFPHAQIYFDQFSEYFINATNMISRTEAYMLLFKFGTPIMRTGIRAFAEAGPSLTTRSDPLAEGNLRYDANGNPIGATNNIIDQENRVGATFGGGFNYNLTQRLLAEVSFLYTTGWGASDTYPVYKYIPFLYSVNFGLALRF